MAGPQRIMHHPWQLQLHQLHYGHVQTSATTSPSFYSLHKAQTKTDSNTPHTGYTQI